MDDKHIKLQEAKIANFVSRVENIVDESIAKIFADLRRGSPTAREAILTINDIDLELERRGIQNELREITELYADEIRAIREDFERIGANVQFGGASRELVNQMINFDETRTTQTLGQYITDTKAALIRSYITGEVPEIETLQSLKGRTFANIETDLNTSIAGMQRAVANNTAQEAGIEKFEYTGPLDKVTRPFCREHVGKVYTIEKLKTLDNGQGLPVETYLGGYNCRHRLSPVRE